VATSRGGDRAVTSGSDHPVRHASSAALSRALILLRVRQAENEMRPLFDLDYLAFRNRPLGGR
jgi:hypothetical protein